MDAEPEGLTLAIWSSTAFVVPEVSGLVLPCQVYESVAVVCPAKIVIGVLSARSKSVVMMAEVRPPEIAWSLLTLTVTS